MKDLFLQIVPNLSATPSLTNLVRSKFGVGSSLARPRLAVNFCRLPEKGIKGWVALIGGSSVGGSRPPNHQGVHWGRMAQRRPHLGDLDN